MFIVTTSIMDGDLVAAVQEIYYGYAAIVVSADSYADARSLGFRKLMEIDEEFYVRRRVHAASELHCYELTDSRGVVAILVGES